MKGSKLHKEAKRVISAIQKGGTATFASKLNVGGWKKFDLIVTQVAERCPETAIMLGAPVNRSLYIAVIIPQKSDKAELAKAQQSWLTKSVSNVLTGAKQLKNIEKNEGSVQLLELDYNEAPEQSPFKLIDQVFGEGTAFLKKAGIIEEEDEEYEFGFDDIDSE